MGERHFEMEVAAPFRLDLTVWVLRRRAHNAVDDWDGLSYRRALVLGARPMALAVRQIGEAPVAVLSVEMSGAGVTHDAAVEVEVRRVLDRMLGLSVDLTGFYDLAELDERLAPLAKRFRGVRPTRFPTVFEAVVNAVVCQQLSLDVGVHLLNRVAGRYAVTEECGVRSPCGFPTPAQLAVAEVVELRSLGLSTTKARVLVDIARRVSEGDLNLEFLADLDDDHASRILLSLAGIGRWSTEYILLRGLGRLHVLPGDDVGARNNLQRRFALGAPLDYDAMAELARSWWPYGGLVYFHLLLDSLVDDVEQMEVV